MIQFILIKLESLAALSFIYTSEHSAFDVLDLDSGEEI